MKLAFKQICEIISDYNFYVNPNYSFDIIKFYDYQIKIGELSFIKNIKQIDKLKKMSSRRKNRKSVSLKLDNLHPLDNYFDVLNYFQNSLNNNSKKSKTYIVPANVSDDLFKCGSFNSPGFNKIIEKYEKIIVEINFPSNLFTDLISTLFNNKDHNKIKITIVISKVLHIFICNENWT